MNKIRFSALCLLFVTAVQAQPKTKPVAPVNPLKTSTDSASYILGLIAGYGLVNQGLGDIKLNNAMFVKAVNDVTGKKKPLCSDSAANAFLNNYMTKIQSSKVQPEIDKGKKFLAQNKLKPNVKTTPSGLQYEIIKMGTGIKPAALDTFVANYRGTLIDGTEFDASANRGAPLTLGVSQVVTGWTEGLQLMPVGSKFRFWVPYNLGYGTHGQGAVPGGAVMIFDLELLDVKKKN